MLFARPTTTFMVYIALTVALLLSGSARAIRGNDYNDDGGDLPDFNSFGGGGFGDGKNCKAFKCSSGFEAAQRRPMKLVGTGCSSMGVFTADMSSGDGPVGDCCNRRTACFQTCGMSKAACDKAFETCSKNACNSIFDPEAKKSCESTQSIQVMMAGMGGCKDYDAGQASGCQCMAPEKAVARRERILRDFYKKYNPESEESKVPSLIAKSGESNKKFATLMTQLVGKYPAAIKVKKSEQQEMMERIMREGKGKGPASGDAGSAGDDEVDLDLDGAAKGDDDLDAVLNEQEL